MTAMRYTPKDEIDARVRTLQQTLDQLDLDGALVVHHTNLFYLSGTSQAAHLFVPRTGGPLQGLLSRLGGLTFPDLSAVEAALPGCTLVHARRAGQVQFARFVRGGGSASAGRL